MKKVIVKLRGGLGNQLFQAYAGAHFANKFQSELFLDDVDIANHADLTRRAWLREFKLEYLLNFQSVRWRNYRSSQIISRLPVKWRKEPTIGEIELNAIEQVTSDIRIYDWFINSQYLPSARGSLRRDQIRNLRDTASNLAHLNRNNSESAAIHIRLGDFRRTPWGTLPIEWYQKALEMFVDSGITKVDCYSDDLAGARDIVGSFESKIDFRFPEDGAFLNPHELLFVMSTYHNFISSNSTLSWWAAYYNSHPHAMVISNWNKHLHQANWIRIS